MLEQLLGHPTEGALRSCMPSLSKLNNQVEGLFKSLVLVELTLSMKGIKQLGRRNLVWVPHS